MKRLRLLGGTPARTESLPQWPELNEQDAIELAELISTGPWALGQTGNAPEGKHKALFEQLFAQLCDRRFALAVSSGTTALDLAVVALELSPGGHIVAANYGHPSTVHQAAQSHRLLLLDVDSETLCLDPQQLAIVLNREVRCVITTHFAGQPGSIEQLRTLCTEARVPLIEDASHAHGAMVGQRPAGSFGELGCFSLHATKNLPAGEGGVIVTDDPDLYDRLWRAHDIGRNRGHIAYDFAALGGNYRMSEIHALLALAMLPKLKPQIELCMARAAALKERLDRTGVIELLPVQVGVTRHSYHLLVGRYRPERCQGLSRRRFVLALCGEGIPCNFGWPAPLSELSFLKSVVEKHPTPVTDKAVHETVWLDRRLLLVPDGVDQIVEAIEKIQAHAGALGGNR